MSAAESRGSNTREHEELKRLTRPALTWVYEHPRVLLLTAAHVAVDALLAGVVITLFLLTPFAAIAVLLPAIYVGAFAAALTDAAIIVAVRESVDGGTVSLANAWAVAWRHRKPLAAWAIDLVLVGLGIRLLAAIFGRLGQLLGLAAEIAWTIVALLVVPAIVIGDVGMPDAYDYSRQTLAKTFGNRLSGVGGLTVVSVLVAGGVFTLMVLALLADSGPLILISWAVALLALVAYAFVMDAATAVLGYAIYAHATHDPLPSGFADALAEQGAVR